MDERRPSSALTMSSTKPSGMGSPSPHDSVSSFRPKSTRAESSLKSSSHGVILSKTVFFDSVF